MRKQRGGEVFRITGARQSLDEDVRGRQRRYVVSMLIRTVAVLLTVALWDVQRVVAVVTLVVGGLLPYVAVVIANAGRENPPLPPSSYIPPPYRRELPPTGPGGAASDSEAPAEHPSDTEPEDPSTDRS